MDVVYCGTREMLVEKVKRFVELYSPEGFYVHHKGGASNYFITFSESIFTFNSSWLILQDDGCENYLTIYEA